MATYLEELHDLFPNGLLAVAPPLSDRNDGKMEAPLRAYILRKSGRPFG